MVNYYLSNCDDCGNPGVTIEESYTVGLATTIKLQCDTCDEKHNNKYLRYKHMKELLEEDIWDKSVQKHEEKVINNNKENHHNHRQVKAKNIMPKKSWIKIIGSWWFIFTNEKDKYRQKK